MNLSDPLADLDKTFKQVPRCVKAENSRSRIFTSHR